ncbi:MAG: hypothetical protein ABIH01_00995 [Candidatus Omnitrophota bacterium]
MKNYCVFGICFWFLIFCFLFCNGCAPPPNTQQNLRDEVLKVDPGFAAVLAKKDQIDREIAKANSDFKEGQAALELKIATIRSEIISKKQELNKNIVSMKKQLDPQREEIRSELKSLVAKAISKEDSLRRLTAMEQDAKKLLEKRAVSSGDRTKWENMLPNFVAEAKRLLDEIKTLRAKINLRKIQLQLLRQ